jgi:hypothetical protein
MRERVGEFELVTSIELRKGEVKAVLVASCQFPVASFLVACYFMFDLDVRVLNEGGMTQSTGTNRPPGNRQLATDLPIIGYSYTLYRVDGLCSRNSSLIFAKFLIRIDVD